MTNLFPLVAKLNKAFNPTVYGKSMLLMSCKAGETGGGQGGGQNTWGPDWLGEPKILVKRLVMGVTVKKVGGP